MIKAHVYNFSSCTTQDYIICTILGGGLYSGPGIGTDVYCFPNPGEGSLSLSFEPVKGQIRGSSDEWRKLVEFEAVVKIVERVVWQFITVEKVGGIVNCTIEGL